MSRIKVYVARAMSAAERDDLGRLAPGAELWFADPDHPGPEDRRAFLEAEVVFGNIPLELLGQSDRLRWCQISGVGIERLRGIDWGRIAPRAVVTNAGGVCANSMAQTVLAGVLSLYREIDVLLRLQERRDWQKWTLHPRLRVLDRAEVLLLGHGAVNRRLRELLAPFGCAVTAFARTSGDIRTGEELDRAIPRADLVCAALPDTPATRGLLGPDRIALFKPGAIFTNVGRGNLVDEPSLVAALRSGRMGGALIDVTVREPLPPDDPLWDCPRTLLTQHTSGGSTGIAADLLRVFAENLARYRSGQPLRFVVDWKRGY